MIVITVDGEQAAIDFLQEGKINCVVECTPMLGDIIMDLAKKLAAGEEIPASPTRRSAPSPSSTKI